MSGFICWLLFLVVIRLVDRNIDKIDMFTYWQLDLLVYWLIICSDVGLVGRYVSWLFGC